MKRLVQFNELVFNHTAYISQQPEITTDFRITKNEFVNSHGDYSPERDRGRKIASKTITVPIVVDKNKFNCEDRNFIEQYVQSNLYKIGRLWAVQGDLLLWTVAKVESVSEGLEEKEGKFSYNVVFYLPMGIWYLADSTATYLQDYETCEVMECFEVLKRPTCKCCWCNIGLAPERFCMSCSGTQLCKIPENSLSELIGNCGNNKKINYSCECQEPNAFVYSECGVTTALADFQANTLYMTDDIVIEICGEFTNLTIDFNGEKSVIEGTYSGTTIISGGVVKNNCDYLDIDKFHGVCSRDCSPSDECNPSPFLLKVNDGSNGIVNWVVNTGQNIIRFYGFKKNETQEIRIFVRGIAL